MRLVVPIISIRRLLTLVADIRRVCTVATDHGTLLIIPREKQLVRLYLPLQAVDGTLASLDRSSITLDMIRQKAKQMLNPFDFDFKICDWWTVYQVWSDSNIGF